MGSFGARDAIFPLTLRLEFIEPSTTIVHEPPLPPNPGIGDCAGSSRPRTPSATRSVDSMHLVVITTGTPARGSTSCLSVAVAVGPISKS